MVDYDSGRVSGAPLRDGEALKAYFENKDKSKWSLMGKDRLVIVKDEKGEEHLEIHKLKPHQRVQALWGRGDATFKKIVEFCAKHNLEHDEIYEKISKYNSKHRKSKRISVENQAKLLPSEVKNALNDLENAGNSLKIGQVLETLKRLSDSSGIPLTYIRNKNNKNVFMILRGFVDEGTLSRNEYNGFINSLELEGHLESFTDVEDAKKEQPWVLDAKQPAFFGEKNLRILLNAMNNMDEKTFENFSKQFLDSIPQAKDDNSIERTSFIRLLMTSTASQDVKIEFLRALGDKNPNLALEVIQGEDSIGKSIYQSSLDEHMKMISDDPSTELPPLLQLYNEIMEKLELMNESKADRNLTIMAKDESFLKEENLRALIRKLPNMDDKSFQELSKQLKLSIRQKRDDGKNVKSPFIHRLVRDTNIPEQVKIDFLEALQKRDHDLVVELIKMRDSNKVDIVMELGDALFLKSLEELSPEQKKQLDNINNCPLLLKFLNKIKEDEDRP